MNEHDLRVALVAICEGDSEPGGMRELLPGAHPVRRWGDPALASLRPIVAVSVQPGRNGSGTGSTRNGLLRFTAFAQRGSQGLADRICDRLGGAREGDPGIITTPALLAFGVDCRLTDARRTDVSALTEDEGEALAIEWNYTFTRQ